MGILEESKKKFLEARERWEREAQEKLNACITAGEHDTSKGSLDYIYGTVHASLPVHGCRVNLAVVGECPNCGTHYSRSPTLEERQTPEYQRMAIDLATPESVDRMLHRPMTI